VRVRLSEPRVALALTAALAVAALTSGCTGAATTSADQPMTDEGSIASASSASAAAASAAAGATGSSGTRGSSAQPSASASSGSPSQATATTVDVLITYAGFQAATDTVEVGGVADGIVESDGRCTLTLSSSGRPDVQLEIPATPDVRSTACGGFSVPKAQVASGSWSAHLDYRSSRSAGKAATTFDVP
jgi:hypothetical protein